MKNFCRIFGDEDAVNGTVNYIDGEYTIDLSYWKSPLGRVNLRITGMDWDWETAVDFLHGEDILEGVEALKKDMEELLDE